MGSLLTSEKHCQVIISLLIQLQVLVANAKSFAERRDYLLSPLVLYLEKE